MTTDLSTDSRRSGECFSSSDFSAASQGQGSPTRELPVLFQLTDVSRPKGSRPKPPSPKEAATTPATELQLAPLTDAHASQTPEDDANLLTLSELAKPYTPAALQPSTLWAPSVASLLEDPTADTATPEPAAPAAGAKAGAPPAKQAVQATSETNGKDSSAAATRRREQREAAAKPSPAKKHDWFSSHGKLISIGFVVALAATVYIARSHKQTAAPANEDSWSLKHPGRAADQLAGGPVIEMPSTDSGEPPQEVVASDAKGEASPASADKLVESEAAQSNAGSTAQVDLLPPTLPLQTLSEQSVATGPAPESPPAGAPVDSAVAKTPASETASAPSEDPLFRWPQREAQAEARVATRPELPALAPAPTAQQSMNPGEVLNPYTNTATATAAAPPAGDAPAATVASRSPYVLPSPQETAASPPASTPPPSVYAPANQPAPAYSPQSVYAPAPQTGYSAAPPAAGYSQAPPTTPSPYLPAGAGAPPPAAGQPAPSYGAPPAVAPNTQPPANGYRYERTGSGLY